MRKILSILLVFVIMTVLCENICYASEVVTSDKGNSEQLNITGIGSDAVLVLDVSTGYSIYEKDIYTSYYPASVTKIMTAMIGLGFLSSCTSTWGTLWCLLREVISPLALQRAPWDSSRFAT